MSPGTKSEDFHNLPQAIAHCALRRALRPVLKHDVGFVACLYLERAEDMFTYEGAAEKLLLLRQMNGIRLADDRSSVCAFHDEVAMVNRMRGDNQNYRRVTFLFANEALIPAEFRAAAELVSQLKAPDIRLVQSAVYLYCGERISDRDAHVIANSKWSDLNIVFRKSRSAAQAVNRLRRAAEATSKANAPTSAAIQVPDKTILNKLHGYGEAKAWAERPVPNLELSKQGLLDWRRVQRSLLLFGPPGTGKSVFGRIVAAACGIPLIVCSYADWQSAGHQGEMLAAMKATFKEAKKQAPCVLLLEEIDCFDRRTNNTDHAAYVRGCVSGLLVGLDDLFMQFGVIVIATTNYAHEIDEAILRPGRIDCHVEVQYPQADARCAILGQHLDWPIPDEVADEVAMSTAGMSGAALKMLADQILQHCRTETRPLDADAVRSRLPKVFPVPYDRARSAALHECGHAIVGLAIGRTLDHLKLAESYVPDHPEYELGRAGFEPVHFHRRTPTFIAEEITIALAGLASEMELIGGHCEGVGGAEHSDLVVATELATRYEAIFGMGETLVSEVWHSREQLTRLRNQNLILWRRIDDLLKRQLEEARRIVVENREAIFVLTDRLMDARSMSGAEVIEVLKPFGLAEALDANSHNRGVGS